jgi:hypothetical protein
MRAAVVAYIPAKAAGRKGTLWHTRGEKTLRFHFELMNQTFGKEHRLSPAYMN